MNYIAQFLSYNFFIFFNIYNNNIYLFNVEFPIDSFKEKTKTKNSYLVNKIWP